MLKPAEAASLSTLRLAELLASTDLPAGVVNVVTGTGAEAGEALVGHPDVAKISFTGSTAVGKRVQQLATETLKHVTLELGGKSPTVVFADADLEKAATTAAAGFLGNAGQACVAGSRIFVQEGIRDEFVATLTGVMGTVFVPGDPFIEGTIVGALATKAHFDRVSSYVDIAAQEGANVVVGGGRYGDHGYFFAPTLLDQVTPDMRVVREEIFGPVGVLQTFTDVDDAVAKANDTDYGLAASVFTTDRTSPRRTAWPRASRPAPCGSTPGPSRATRRCRSAGTSSPASAAKAASRCSTPTPRADVAYSDSLHASRQITTIVYLDLARILAGLRMIEFFQKIQPYLRRMWQEQVDCAYFEGHRAGSRHAWRVAGMEGLPPGLEADEEEAEKNTDPAMEVDLKEVEAHVEEIAGSVPEVLEELERELVEEARTVWEVLAGFCEEELGIGPETLLEAHFGTMLGQRN